MKLVTRKQLMEMPDGTLYNEWVPAFFGPLCIKTRSIPNLTAGGFCDWEVQRVPEIGGADVMMDKLAAGEAVYIDFKLTGREGLFDEEARYAVWSREDVYRFREVLTQSIISTAPQPD